MFDINRDTDNEIDTLRHIDRNETKIDRMTDADRRTDTLEDKDRR